MCVSCSPWWATTQVFREAVVVQSSFYQPFSASKALIFSIVGFTTPEQAVGG